MFKAVVQIVFTLLVIFTTRDTQAGFILVGQHELLPNQANQIINILAQPMFAGELAPGLNLNFVLDDGGSVVGGIDGNAPLITAINLKPVGGLFAGIPDSQTIVFQSPELYQLTIAPTNVANRPEITSNVLLAQITFNTSGLTSGNWVLNLDGLPGVGLPKSDFAGSPTTVFNGSISIAAVPEPGSGCVLLLTAVGLLLRGRTKRVG